MDWDTLLRLPVSVRIQTGIALHWTPLRGCQYTELQFLHWICSNARLDGRVDEIRDIRPSGTFGNQIEP